MVGAATAAAAAPAGADPLTSAWGVEAYGPVTIAPVALAET